MAIPLDGFISPPNMPVGKDFNDPAVKRELNRFYEKLANRMTRISFLPPDGTIATDDKPLNLDGIWVIYTSNGTANTEDTVAHKLGRVPNFVLVGIPDKSATVYESTTARTTTNIFLKSSAVTTVVNVLLF